METRLTYLYALQNVDSQLQDILELKGDLPAAVAALQRSVDESAKKLQEMNDLITRLTMERDTTDVELISYTEKIEKYKEQQMQVKSNKQYDALTKEIETTESLIRKAETTMETCEGQISVTSQDITALSKSLAELQAELQEKQLELTEVNKEHEKEESRLTSERTKLLKKIQTEDVTRYERIRKAKGGTAIVPVKRSACGGCFNRVPPQKILELRQNNKIYMCEHCGRILVSDDVVSKSIAVV
ncbi:MAG: hypothetical protein EPO24_14100 [Bacteroidetes bacterium]|nr:MAG: hypothetical protein EPO24_14100 [Bacteroidota bacterium]